MIDDNCLIKSKAQQKTILLIGLMGCGKTSVGKRLARLLDMKFVDADSEIEKAAGLSVSDIFKLYGEDEFRAGERRVMKRLLGCDLVPDPDAPLGADRRPQTGQLVHGYCEKSIPSGHLCKSGKNAYRRRQDESIRLS